MVYLSNGGREQVDDAFVRDRHHTLRVDLDDAMPHTHAAALRYTAAQETADLAVVNDILRISEIKRNSNFFNFFLY